MCASRLFSLHRLSRPPYYFAQRSQLACASMLDITAIKQHCESTIGEMIRIDGRGVFTFAGHTLLPLKLSPYADTTPEWASSTSSFARHCEASGAGGCVAAGSLSLGGTSEATAACSWENVEKCVCDVLQVMMIVMCFTASCAL